MDSIEDMQEYAGIRKPIGTRHKAKNYNPPSETVKRDDARQAREIAKHLHEHVDSDSDDPGVDDTGFTRKSEPSQRNWRAPPRGAELYLKLEPKGSL